MRTEALMMVCAVAGALWVAPATAESEPACVCDESVPLPGAWNGRMLVARMGGTAIGNPFPGFDDLTVDRLQCGQAIRVTDPDEAFAVTADRRRGDDGTVHYRGEAMLEGGALSIWRFYGEARDDLATAMNGTIEAPPYDFEFTMRRRHGPQAARPLAARCRTAEKLLADSRAMRRAFADTALLEEAIERRLPAFDAQESMWIDEAAWADGKAGFSEDLETGGKTYYDLVIDAAMPGESSSTLGALGGTDPRTCAVDVDREALEDQCFPDAAIDAIEAHEGGHRRDCLRVSEDFPRPLRAPKLIRYGWFNHPANLRRTELAAYDETIARLAPWVEENCGG